MITCKLMGRLGNQMFQVATTIAHAIKMDTSYGFPSRSGKWEQFPFMFTHLTQMPNLELQIFKPTLYREKQFGVYNELPSVNDLHLRGYFQSEKYFKDYRKEVIDSFRLPFSSCNKNIYSKGWVGVHVRRGDYLKHAWKHNVLTKQWIEKAMSSFGNNYNFVFFSDDFEWCQSNFSDKDNVFYSWHDDPKEAMVYLSSCEHGIMSPSSFSWWANWISENNGKGRRVVAPLDWFNPNYKKLSSKDIVPENWERL